MVSETKKGTASQWIESSELQGPVNHQTGLLKLAIHVGGNHKMRTAFCSIPTLDETKAAWGKAIAVQIGAVGRRKPQPSRIALKMLRVGTLHKQTPGVQ